jgi:hypothetical protein
MGFLNTTRNQHYISRAELSLNAINPSAAKRNQRIHRFAVQNREEWQLRLEHPHGVGIGRALSQLDLFSFDVLGDGLRANLEDGFRRYEAVLARESGELLRMVETGEQARIKAVLQSVFGAKLLGSLRNPFCVRKALSTIAAAAQYSPTDSQLHAAYSRVLAGAKPHRDDVCAKFGLGSEEYETWLRCLFMMIAVAAPGEGTILDMALALLFATSAWGAGVYGYIGTPDEQVCLLSDRGFNTLQNDQGTLTMEFNVASRVFVRFGFLGVSEALPETVRRHGLAALMSGLSPDIRVINKDLAALIDYNRRTLYQCKERVYSASDNPYGVYVNRGPDSSGRAGCVPPHGSGRTGTGGEHEMRGDGS